MRKSLKTPDETVTVNFVPQQSNVKKSFPVTHARLLNEDDLSSPGEKGRRREEWGGREGKKVREEWGGREGEKEGGVGRERERE